MIQVDENDYYKEEIEEGGNRYVLTIMRSSNIILERLSTPRHDGFTAYWMAFRMDDGSALFGLPVTDEKCKVVFYENIPDAIEGAKEFLEL